VVIFAPDSTVVVIIVVTTTAPVEALTRTPRQAGRPDLRRATAGGWMPLPAVGAAIWERAGRPEQRLDADGRETHKRQERRRSSYDQFNCAPAWVGHRVSLVLSGDDCNGALRV